MLLCVVFSSTPVGVLRFVVNRVSPSELASPGSKFANGDSSLPLMLGVNAVPSLVGGNRTSS